MRSLRWAAATVSVCSLLWITSGLVFASGPPQVDRGDKPQGVGGFVCRTEINVEEASGGKSARDGQCPYIVGKCDEPEVWDAFIPGTAQVLTLRLHFNVFCDNAGQNCALSQSEIDDQMGFTNAAFAEANVEFVYATEFINNSTFLNVSLGQIGAMKQQYADDPLHQLNVYVVASEVGGMATFPWAGNALSWSGGIYMSASSFAPDKHWLTHEIGHCIGLLHTHQGTVVYDCGESGLLDAFEPCYEYADGSNGDTSGDFCSDTRPTPVNRSCDQPDPSEVDCAGTPWGMTDIENIMGYSIDEDPYGYYECRTEFAGQQWGRVHCWVNEKLTCWIVMLPGDVNCSGRIDISDAVYLVNYIYHGGPAPCPLPNVGDLDCSGGIDVDDVYVLIDYIFRGGPAPVCCAD